MSVLISKNMAHVYIILCRMQKQFHLRSLVQKGKKRYIMLLHAGKFKKKNTNLKMKYC